jgi:hypothetical protein
MINRGLAELVIDQFGAAEWDEIRTRAGVGEMVFLSAEQYPDELTYTMLGAAAEVLGMPLEEILMQFGEYWIVKTARDGYGGMLLANGKSLPEFLINLPSLHNRVAMLFPHLEPPHFSLTEVTGESLKLHYRSKRPGLTSFVIGLLRGLGKMFETEVETVLLCSKDAGDDHDIFMVKWKNSTNHGPGVGS